MGFPILSDEQLERLDVVDSSVCAPKQVLVVRGEVLGAVFLVNRGAVAAEYRRGPKKLLLKLEAGEFFNEETLRDLPAGRTIRVVEESTVVIAVSPASFIRLLDSDPELNRLYVETKTDRLALLDRMFLEAGSVVDRRDRPNEAPRQIRA